jgi:hypothetical protein
MKYDPDGKGFVKVADFDHLILDLMVEGCQLIPAKMWFKESEKARRNFIANLRIATYKKFKYYLFYDVILNLCRHKCSIKFLNFKIQNDFDRDKKQR